MDDRIETKLPRDVGKILRGVYELRSIEKIRLVIEHSQKILNMLQLFSGTQEDELEDTEIEEAKLVTKILETRHRDLTGPENALLASFLLRIQTQQEEFTARQINRALKIHEIHIANISTTMNALNEKKLIRISKEEGSQRAYSLTNDGFQNSRTLIAEHM